MTVGELNTRVTVKHYDSVQDSDTGVITSSLVASWVKWAKVVQKNGSRVLDNAAITYKEAFEITIRYEVSRPTLDNYKIEYRGKDLTIHSVVRKDEGNTWYELINAYTEA